MITRQSETVTAHSGDGLPYWSSKVSALATPCQRRWLTRPGALTEGLRKLGMLELDVIRESIARPSGDELAAMGLASGVPSVVPSVVPVRIREIRMSIDGRHCVVARSVVSLPAWSGSWRALRHLGRRPLADLLYSDRRVSRSVFETARLRCPHPLARVAWRSEPSVRIGHGSSRHQALWARRSVFWRNGCALLVAECFLPGFWDLVATSLVATSCHTNG